MLIHSPLRHLNLVGPSQWVAVTDKWTWDIFYIQSRGGDRRSKRRVAPLMQPTSSLMSLQSYWWLHWRLPWMHVPSPHSNSSGRHVERAGGAGQIKRSLTLDKGAVSAIAIRGYCWFHNGESATLLPGSTNTLWQWLSWFFLRSVHYFFFFFTFYLPTLHLHTNVCAF